jgi:site-specific DNA recombinase
MRIITKINPSGIDNLLSKPKKIRTAAYARVSTDSTEQLQSFNAQVEHYTNFINSNPAWEFAGVYADEGISGTKKENRTELLRLLSDCESKKIDFIITKSISRFARNTTDCLEIVRRLTDISIYILFEKENINTKTTDSELILTILSSLAAEESISISQNNKWSVQKRFKNGTYKISAPIYGYDYNGETIIPNMDQTKIVRQIFTEVLSGSGARAVAMHLNADGIQPPRGQKWTDTSILGILENEKYIGDVLHQKTYTDDNFIRHGNKGEKDKFYLQDNHVAIISIEDFESVASLIKQRGHEKGVDDQSTKYQNRYSFSGIIICGECSSTFKRRVHLANKAGQYIAWCCKNHIDTNGKDCSMLFIRDENIKSAFVMMMNKLYSNRNQILKPLLQALKQIDSGGKYAEIIDINGQINEISDQEQSIVGLYTRNIIEPIQFYEKQNSLQAELIRLKEKKAILNGSVEGEKTMVTETEGLYKYLNKDGCIIEVFDDELFIRFVSGIIVISPTVIGFKLKNGLCLRERTSR